MGIVKTCPCSTCLYPFPGSWVHHVVLEASLESSKGTRGRLEAVLTTQRHVGGSSESSWDALSDIGGVSGLLAAISDTFWVVLGAPTTRGYLPAQEGLGGEMGNRVYEGEEWAWMNYFVTPLTLKGVLGFLPPSGPLLWRAPPTPCDFSPPPPSRLRARPSENFGEKNKNSF